MASGDQSRSRPGTSRNIFDLVQTGDNDDQANSIDRKEDDAEVCSEGDLSDEDEFVPFRDDSGSDSEAI
ncbi:hypothetical protein RRG08_017836 [Elysia crispata]|uniref:Uncharacterized protein n=1 Tax=Elysia crispata TaxID=231223 RepID=A0AAE0XPI9_9GAST|nr:hypothetical protein RRG08_017836 [Elysia crispata]